MGDVIRPQAFVGRLVLAPPRKRKLSRAVLLGITPHLVAAAALIWILTLAGAAFAVRTVLIVCFAALAGRARQARRRRSQA